MKLLRNIMMILFFSLLVMIIVICTFYNYSISPVDKKSDEEIEVVIPNGVSTTEIGSILKTTRENSGVTIEEASADLNIKDIANLCDVFYIGGTKNGALFGEAIVFTNSEKFNLRLFTTLVKQQGGLLAKGRLLGLQYEVLFEGENNNNLYFENARHADIQAMKIKKAFELAKIPFLFESFTNQQFPILTQEQHKKLSSEFDYETWEPLDDNRIAVRFVTSWATSDDNIEKLVMAIKSL